MGYRRLDKAGRVYLKEGSKTIMGKISKIIFDCDGVLLSVNKSYREAIRKTVDHYFKKILRLKGEGGLVTRFDIQRFKDTGRYNNDWQLSHSLVAFYLAILFRKLHERSALSGFMEEFGELQFDNVENFTAKLSKIGDYCSRQGIGIQHLLSLKANKVLGIAPFLEKSSNVEEALGQILPYPNSDQVALIQKLVPYNSQGDDLLKRLFEEIYLGGSLFSRFYGIRPFFKFKKGLIEKEQLIPSKKTLSLLNARLGKFGVYSERPRSQGLYVIEQMGVTRYFDEKALYFYDDLAQFAGRGCDAAPKKTGKPDPSEFIALADKMLGTVDVGAYVGDTVSDALLVRNAREKGLENIAFIGTLSSSSRRRELFSKYEMYAADAIIMDANDLPFLLEKLS